MHVILVEFLVKGTFATKSMCGKPFEKLIQNSFNKINF